MKRGVDGKIQLETAIQLIRNTERNIGVARAVQTRGHRVVLERAVNAAVCARVRARVWHAGDTRVIAAVELPLVERVQRKQRAVHASVCGGARVEAERQNDGCGGTRK